MSWFFVLNDQRREVVVCSVDISVIVDCVNFLFIIIVVEIVWQLDLQLLMQSVLITTNVSSNPTHDVVYSIQHNVIKFVSNLWHIAGRWFSEGTLVSSTNKTDHYAITEMSLKVALNIITSPFCSPYRSVQHALFWHSSSVLLLP